MTNHRYPPKARHSTRFRRPYPWECSKMTICIAVVCNAGKEGGKKIILCTDWRQSSPIGMSDTIYKQPWLPKNWRCLTAGTTTEINALVPKLREKFKNENEITETNIVRVVQSALRERLKEKRDEYAYGEYSRGYDEVMSNGKAIFPEGVYNKFVHESSNIDLGAELIIAGFVNNDEFIIVTTLSGEVKLPTDFSCIGEGEYLAQASLLRREYMDIRNIGVALYQVYEAKRAAERVNSVSELTLIIILNEDGTHKHISQKKMTWFKGLYSDYGPKNTPASIELPDDLFS